MLSVLQARKVLGKKYASLTDSEIEALLTSLYELGNFTVVLYMKQNTERDAKSGVPLNACGSLTKNDE